ncbi:potassium channel family protein [Sulfurisphaera tokodaii]|uniref:Potassium channel protein n=2 Tax=Sulfurisphaera tokodaii TaxID=111955 RepID=Q96XR4_SULTO|nr:NAD-binding protein [Sulfurisphaera tokodaii]BAB67563.1 putative potassium channel protein [Sulfurisphaera tokodaii str. 7]HII74562.1 potassium transporter TrkA [Sulfurisphaera tokodaii]
MDKIRIWNKYIIRILETIAAPYSVLRRIYIQLVLLSIVVYTIALVFVYYQGLDWISAIYAAVNVITTVGLYAPDIYQMPSQEKLFLTVMILFTVGLFASMAQSLISTILNRNTWIDARARWRGKLMKGHIVVIGNTESILSAVKRLEILGKDYVVVTSSKKLYDELKSDKVIFGDPNDENNLLTAGIKNASSAIIAMEDDSQTLLITLKVQKLNPPLIIVTMIKDSSLIDVFKTAGADIVIPFEEFMGRIMASAAISKNFAGIVYPSSDRDYSIGVFEVKKNFKLSELPEGIIPIAILHDGKLDPYFSKETEVKPGEILFVLGNPLKFKDVSKLVE